MSGKFSADLDEMRARVPEVDRTAEDVATTVQTLRTSLAAEGEPWGTDEAGRAFAGSYLPDYQRTMADLDALVRMLRQGGGDLHRLANGFEAADARGARRIANAANMTEPGVQPISAANNGPAGTTDSVTPTVRTATRTPPAGNIPESAGPIPGSAASVPGASSGGDAGPDVVTSATRRPATPDPSGATPDTDATPDTNSAAPTDPSRTGDSGVPGANGQPDGPASSEPVGPVPNPGAGTITPPSPATQPASTPWSRTGMSANQPSTGTSSAARPAPSNAAGPPRVSAPASRTGAPGSPPRQPVRPSASGKDKKRDRKTTAPGTDESLAVRLTRELAEKYGVRAFGFDTPGIPDEVLLELVAAIDEVLPRNPGMALGEIGIRALATGALTRLEWDAISGTARISLAARAATDRTYLESGVAADERLQAVGQTRRPVFACVIRELGRVREGVDSGGVSHR
ncbi:hypothetical protein [Nocardia sp. NPDC056100]|uniref:hypothetical protein n=1 Tax=Nocardia sp. NPDC056100 TaxID=3345712 RepID=UPI0035DB7972